MKNLIYFILCSFISFSFFYCTPKIIEKIILVKDTVYVKNSEDSLAMIIMTNTIDSLNTYYIAQLNKSERYKIENDSLKNKLRVSMFKIERVRYYNNICIRNNSQTIFLKGWIKRAIAD